MDFYEMAVNSSRPSKPKMDPFKKFDNMTASRNRTLRLFSFDDGRYSKTQGSNSSFN